MNLSTSQFKTIVDSIATLLLGAGVGAVALQEVANPVVWAWTCLGIGSVVKLAVLSGGNHKKQPA